MRGAEVWRGILSGGVPGDPATVSIDGAPDLPAVAPAYRFLPSTVDDLRRVAERYAGGDPACGDEPCVYTTSDAALALAAVTTGGIGNHDHTVANAVPGQNVQLLVPVLRAGSTTPLAANTGTFHLSAIALSSALLVDDPGHADLARRAPRERARVRPHVQRRDPGVRLMILLTPRMPV